MKQNKFLKQVYVALNNALNNPELQTILQEYGYNEKKLRDGLKRYEGIEQLTQQQQMAWYQAKSTSQILKDTRQQLTVLFQMHLDTARLAYKREAAYTDTLGLTRARNKATLDLLDQARMFYTHIPVAMMEKYHAPQKELNEAGKLVNRVFELVALQRQAQAQVQTLTQTRNAAIHDLKIWMRSFLTIAKIACHEHPQQLEALDVVVTS
ncbi:MAG: hypothetical protein RIG62_19375 [Cyclobacteriaceae bacterium]